MSNGGLLRAVLEVLAAALGPSRRSRTSGARRDGRAVLRSTRGAVASPRTTPAGYVESPGRRGSDATRDLTAGEIRALRPSYAPVLDGDPDPGEVVWTWVPYVENDGRGKDRPVLIIARLADGSFAACYLSTKQHRGFISIGTGPWDTQGRESFLSPDRVLRVTDAGMRRESMGIERPHYDRVIEALSHRYGFPA